MYWWYRPWSWRLLQSYCPSLSQHILNSSRFTATVQLRFFQIIDASFLNLIQLKFTQRFWWTYFILQGHECWTLPWTNSVNYIYWSQGEALDHKKCKHFRWLKMMHSTIEELKSQKKLVFKCIKKKNCQNLSNLAFLHQNARTRHCPPNTYHTIDL